MERKFEDLIDANVSREVRPFGLIVGRSLKMQQVMDLAAKLAKSHATVLITGESGTGKELIARTIHNMSPRSTRPFVPVNCAALPEELLETELFGHVRGAFTGAVNARQGRLQLANNSTLFLDEVGEMSPKLQVKLLRVLQEWEFEPVGSDKTVRVDVSVVAATNLDLRLAIKERRFRDDLFYRLNVIPLHIPPLRERPEDIPHLVVHFLQHYSRRNGRVVEKLEEEALALLAKYHWPGNVRELENLMERLVVLNDDGVIRADNLPNDILEPPGNEAPDSLLSGLSLPVEGVNLDAYVQKMENKLILLALSRSNGNKTLAAGLLRLNRTTLIERMRRRELETSTQQTVPPLPVSEKRHRIRIP